MTINEEKVEKADTFHDTCTGVAKSIVNTNTKGVLQGTSQGFNQPVDAFEEIDCTILPKKLNYYIQKNHTTNVTENQATSFGVRVASIDVTCIQCSIHSLKFSQYVVITSHL